VIGHLAKTRRRTKTGSRVCVVIALRRRGTITECLDTAAAAVGPLTSAAGSAGCPGEAEYILGNKAL
jgi:hypothetical protein